LRVVRTRTLAFAAGGFAILVAAYGVLLGRIVSGSAIPTSRDQAAYYWPVKSLLQPLARLSGGLPLWNPLLASGQPFAANPEHAVFHPLTAFFLVLPFELAFRLQVLLPVAAALLTAFFLGRALELGLASALVLAGSWAFGGYVLSNVDLLPILYAVAALPAALAYAVRLGRRSRTADVAGLGVSLGFVVLSGEPSTLLLCGVLLPAAFLHGRRIAVSSGEPGDLPGGLRRLGVGLLLGAGIGAVVLIPGLDHARKTVRAKGLDRAAASEWSTPPVRLLELFVPDLCAMKSTAPEAIAWRKQLYPKRDFPFFFSIYPGLLVAALAVLSWLRPRAPERVWLPVALLGVLVAAGSDLPFWGLAQRLPLLSGLRYPEKFLLLAAVAVTVSGACRLESLLQGAPSSRWKVAVGFLALALLFALLRLGPFPGDVFAGSLARQAIVATLCGAALLLAARPGSASDHAPLSLLLVLLTAGDLAEAGRRFLVIEPIETMKVLPPQLAALVTRPPNGYLAHLADRHPTLYRLSGLGAPPIPAQWRIPTALDRDFDLTELAWSARATTTVLSAVSDLPAARTAIFQRRGIAALLHFRPGAPSNPAEAARIPLATLLQLSFVPDPKPFAFLANRIRVVDGEAGWRSAMESLGSAAADTACVDRADAAGLPTEVTPGSVTVVEQRPNGLSLSVSSPGDAFLCVNQTWDPGWVATVDGAPARVYRTDLSLCGVAIPRGEHRVVLAYRNRWIATGIAITLVSLAACALLVRRSAESAA